MIETFPYPIFEAARVAFLKALQDAPNTRKTYASGLSLFECFLEERGYGGGQDSRARLSVDAFDDDLLEAFYRWLTSREYSKFSVRTYVAAVSAFLTYLLSHDQLPPTFSMEKAKAKLRRPMKRTPYPVPIPDPELPRIIEYYDKLPLPEGNTRRDHLEQLRLLRSRAIVHTLYASAGRIAEVAALDRKDVANGRRSEALITGKGDKQRFIYLTPEAQQAIAAYVAARQDTFQPLFISHGRDYGSRLSKVSIWATVKRAAKTLGMEVTPHDFRHFRARQMLDEGAPLEAIQDILGHADISTTRRVYAQYSKPSIREIFTRATLSPDEALQKHQQRQREEAERARRGR